MNKQGYCKDIYGEKLKIGDEVIPVMSEALIIDIGGKISDIKYSEEYNNYYITIVDEEGNVLLNGVDSQYYTTKERFEERECNDNIYYLEFYDEKLLPITSLPLSNRTDENYEIPDNTNLVELRAEYLTNINDHSKSYISSKLFSCFYEDNIKLNSNPEGYKYIISKLGGFGGIWLDEDYKIVKDQNELIKLIKDFIKTFKREDLTNINNDIVYKDNKEIHKFEKVLKKQINK